MALNFLSRLTGSFAMPAAENSTVAMVEAAYRHHRLDIRYINCEVPPERLADAVKGARAMGWIGFNCSIPHKVAVIEHLDGLGESAAVMGAVNCAVRRGDKFIGENTDGKGFLQSLREVVDPSGKTVAMFGAGGAARAIGVELALAGATRITVVNRGESRGRTLVDLLNRKTKAEAELVVQGGAYKIPTEADIVVNARREPSIQLSATGWVTRQARPRRSGHSVRILRRLAAQAPLLHLRRHCSPEAEPFARTRAAGFNCSRRAILHAVASPCRSLSNAITADTLIRRDIDSASINVRSLRILVGGKSAETTAPPRQ